MLRGFMDIKVTENLTADLKKTIEALAKKTVCVGIPGEANVEKEGGGITNAQLLHVHTHGVRDKAMREEMQKNVDKDGYTKAHELYLQEFGSPMYHTPPRPVLVPALDDGREVLAQLMQEGATDILNGHNANMALQKVGQEGQNMARDWFVDPANNWPPNAPTTVDAKGSARPLIDKGELRKSIIWVIKDGDKK